jgi:transcriptional regulator with XRE-family HTH domain
MTMLKFLRLNGRLTQSELSAAVEVPRWRLALAESGELALRVDELKNLEDFFGVPAPRILEDFTAEGQSHE